MPETSHVHKLMNRHSRRWKPSGVRRSSWSGRALRRASASPCA